MIFKRYISISFLLVAMLPGHMQAQQLSSSTEVQANIEILRETNSCSQCNLSGADLNRLDLSNANLEGANLSRAKLSLSNLSGANLRNADLREAVFSGADLGDADLRGADLTGASLVGAYLGGTVMDGEMVSTTPYAEDEISDIEESVYVEDTVHPKAPQETEEMSIAARRDFEETPPAVPTQNTTLDDVKKVAPVAQVENITLSYADENEEDVTLPALSAAAPDAKTVPGIQEVYIKQESIEQEKIVEQEEIIEQEEMSVAEVEEVSDTEVVEELQVQQEKIIVSEQEIEVLSPENQEDTIVVVEVESIEEESIEEESIEEVEETETVAIETLQAPQESEAAVSDAGSVAQEETLEAVADELVKDEDREEVEQSAGIVQSMLNVFSSSDQEEPLTEIMQNVAQLLDTNKCYGCVLSGVDLSGENLDGADLESADLSNAILRDVDFEGANLKGANLSGADLSEADLSEADLYSADLSGANLTDANLEGTFLDDVNFTGVKGYNKQSLLLMDAE